MSIRERAGGQTGEDAAVASIQVGRCACGNPGKPLATMQSGTGYVCLSCLIREAMEKGTPLAARRPMDRLMPVGAKEAKSLGKYRNNSN